MSDTSSYGLRELAHKYYMGELSYELYRHQRTQLLDGLTQQDDDDSIEPATRPMQEKPGASQASGFRWPHSLLILIMLLLTILVIIWLTKPGWLVTSKARMHNGTKITMINVNQPGCNDTEGYANING